jgi:hypothetical protein
LSDRKVEIHKKVATLGSMSGAKWLRLIGEGLPVLLASAQELADAEKQLPREHQRARAILIGQAEEEAAKILICWTRFDVHQSDRRTSTGRFTISTIIWRG